MRRLTVFNQQSLDGYFSSTGGDVSWTHPKGEDPEFAEFSANNARSGGVLVFGRTTYEMMASFWTMPVAAKQFPVLAEQMTKLPKIVFSRTITKPTWNNTTVMKGDVVAELRKLKSEPGADMAILGSGSIVAPLVQAGLIDQLGIMVIPVVLGAGRTMFAGVEIRLDFTLASTRSFRNGRVFSSYEPKLRG